MISQMQMVAMLVPVRKNVSDEVDEKSIGKAIGTLEDKTDTGCGRLAV